MGVLLGAASSAPALNRLDATTLQQGDGPIVIALHSTSPAFANESNDRFSARLLPQGTTTGDWVPCAATGSVCTYASGTGGNRTLRFEKIAITGELQIRYAVEGGPPSSPIFITISAPPAADTLKAIARSFGGPAPAPNATASATLEVSIDAPAGTVAPRAVAVQSQTGPELVHVTCATVPLYADTQGKAIFADNTVLVARAGEVFLAQRASVRGKTGTLRVLDLGARVYIDAGCVRP